MTKKHEVPIAESIMKRHVFTVTPGMSLTDVVRELVKHKIACTPVVDAVEGRTKTLVGFVTEGDCLEHLAGEMFYGNPRPPQSAATIMKKHPICVTPDTDLFSLASLFVSHRLRHLPVVDAAGQLVGLIGRREMLVALEHHYDLLDQDYQSEHNRPDLHKIMNLRFVAGSG